MSGKDKSKRKPVGRSKYEKLVMALCPNWVPFYESQTVEIYTHYVPDFTLPKTNGDVMHVELKGRLRKEDMAKLVKVKTQHPELDLRILFQKDGKCETSTSGLTYMEWASKHNIPAAVFTPLVVFPPEWLEEVAL